MEKKKTVKISLSSILLIIAIIIICIMGCLLFVLYRNKENDTKKSTILNEENSSQISEDKKNSQNSDTDDNDEDTDVSTEIARATNNGENFVEYDGFIYYWKLNKKSRENTALYAQYSDNVDAINQLIKYSPTTDEKNILLEDKGSQNIYIMNDRIFLSYAEDNDYYSFNRKIYSVNLDGQDKIEYKSGLMKLSIGDYIICQSGDGEIFRINTKTNEVEILKENAGILGSLNDTVYYITLDTEYYSNLKYNVNEVNVGSISRDTDNGIIANISRSEFNNISDQTIEVTNFWIENNLINFYISYSDGGSANSQAEMLKVSMEKDGTNTTTTHLAKQEGGLFANEHIEIEQVSIERENNSIYLVISNPTGEKKLLELVDSDPYAEEEVDIYASTLINDDIYIVLDFSQYSPEASIGWRYGYEITMTTAFIYNTKTEEIKDLYEIY